MNRAINLLVEYLCTLLHRSKKNCHLCLRYDGMVQTLTPK